MILQRNKGLGQNRFKTEISIWNIRLLCKIQRAQKKRTNEWVLQKCYSFAGEGLGKKFWHTAIADSAIDWEVAIVANWCVYRENVYDEKW